MAGHPPKKRKQCGASLQRICVWLRLPYRKTKEQRVNDSLNRAWQKVVVRGEGPSRAEVLAERLRSYPRDRNGNFDKLAYLSVGDEAANFIELQNAEIERLRTSSLVGGE